MKIIIYGVGKIFQKYAKYINFDEVEFLADKIMGYQPLYGKRFISPDAIVVKEYDYIVLFTKYENCEIRDYLISLGIKKEKIISWVEYLFGFVFEFEGYISEDYNAISRQLKTLEVQTCLDINHGIITNGFHIQKKDILNQFYNVVDCEIDKKRFLHGNIYNEVKSSFGKDKYDIVFALDYFKTHTKEEWDKVYETLKGRAKYLLLCVPHSGAKLEDDSWNNYDLEKNCIYRINSDVCQILFLEMDNSDNYIDDVGMYIVTHCEFDVPSEAGYIPIQVGGKKIDESYISDNTKDNIAYLNNYINEATAIYWIWKNSTKNYIGIDHYRRYFVDEKGKILSCSKIKKILSEVDFIVTDPSYVKQSKLKKQIQTTVEVEVFEDVFEQFRETILEKYPEYILDFDTYFEGHFMYARNMFISRKDKYGEYCRWLFDIVLDVVKKIDLKKLDLADSYTRRTIGFIVERLFGLYVLHNDLRVYECPFITINS